MKTVHLLVLILVFGSCNTGRQYANYRFGGKSKHDSETKTDSVSKKMMSRESMDLKETVFVDTLTIKKLPGNKTMIVLKEKTQKEKKEKTQQKKQTHVHVSESKKTKLPDNRKKINFIHPFEKTNAYSGFWETTLLWSLVIGVIAFMLFDSIGAGILFAFLTTLALVLVVAIAIGLAFYLFFYLIFQGFGGLRHSKNFKISKAEKSPDPWRELKIIAWSLILVSVTALLLTLLYITSIWLAVLSGAIFGAILLYGVFLLLLLVL